MLFDDMLIHKAAILELDMVDDGEGGQIEKWVDTGNRLSCLFDTPSSAEQYRYAKLNKQISRNMFYYPTDLITPKSRIRDDDTKVVYEQVSKPDDQGGQGEMYQLALLQVENGA